MDPAPAAELRLLGPPHWQAGELRHDLPDTIPAYLLARLALAAGDWITRDELALLFWPQAAAAEAQHNLRVNLNRLRTLLQRWQAEAALQSERRRLRLALPSDVQHLRADLAQAHWVAAAQRPAGDLLQGLSLRNAPVFAEWVTAQRETWRSEWRRAVLAAARTAGPVLVSTLAERYLHTDPLDEAIVRVQLQAWVAAGRGEEARRRLESFDRRLRAETGHGAGAALHQVLPSAEPPPGTAGTGDGTGTTAAALPLIGREAELAELVARVPTTPLLTLTGLGGVGKTRLAQAARAALVARHADSALWLPLADASGVADAVRRMADALGVAAPAGTEPLGHLCAVIGERDLLIVLDNVEHLFDERAALQALVQRLLEACPRLRLLLTSREPLQLAAEQVLALGGLALPAGETPAAVRAAPAVQLFVAQARHLQPGFDAAAQVPALARIARATGGLPLALRIAAAWTGLLSCSEVAAELERGLDALASPAGRGPGLRAVLAASWQRLPAPAQTLLMRLAVFQSPFDLAAARAVAEADLPGLAQLAAASLLETEAGESERTQFSLHPLVQHFAREHLTGAPALQRETEQRHAQQVARLLARHADWPRIDQRRALQEIGQQLEEARAAWSYALRHGDADFIAQVAPVLCHWFEHKGQAERGLALFAAAEAVFDPGERRERAALAALARSTATLRYRLSDADGADAAARVALRHARALGHHAGIVDSLNVLALSAWVRGRYDEGQAAALEALALARQHGDAAREALLAGTAGLFDKMAGRYDATLATWEHALALHREVGNLRSAVTMLNNLGSLCTHLKRFDAAQHHLDEGLRLADEHGFSAVRPVLLLCLAQLKRAAGHGTAAVPLAELAAAEARRLGNRSVLANASVLLSNEALAQGDRAGGAAHLVQALRAARDAGDAGIQLEALAGFSLWQYKCGAVQPALATLGALLRHPQLHAELREGIVRRMALFRRESGAADTPPPAGGEPETTALLTELALRALGGNG